MNYYTIEEIRKKVYLIEAGSQYYISSMFMRIQEFYESPFSNIKGKYFSFEECMDTYAESKGSFSYFTDWAGFNIPSNVFKEFFCVFSYDLNRKEKTLFDLVRKINPEVEGDFYVIGVSRETEYELTIKHELAHAYWFLNKEYKNEMNKKVKDIDILKYNAAHKYLYKRGYDDSVIIDEIQAYLSTSPRKDLISCLGWQNIKNLKIPTTFKKFFNKFDSAHK